LTLNKEYVMKKYVMERNAKRLMFIFACVFIISSFSCGDPSHNPDERTLEADGYCIQTGEDPKRMAFQVALVDGSGYKVPVEDYSGILHTPSGDDIQMWAKTYVNVYYVEIPPHEMEYDWYTLEARTTTESWTLKDYVGNETMPAMPEVATSVTQDGVLVKATSLGANALLLSVQQQVQTEQGSEYVYSNAKLYNMEFESPIFIQLWPGEYQLRVTGVKYDPDPDFDGDTDARSRTDFDGFLVEWD
jgi:hypothetical protein